METKIKRKLTTGQKIKEAREELGLTLEELGELVQEARQNVWKIEAGIRKEPKKSTLEKYAKALKTTYLKLV